MIEGQLLGLTELAQRENAPTSVIIFDWKRSVASCKRQTTCATNCKEMILQESPELKKRILCLSPSIFAFCKAVHIFAIALIVQTAVVFAQSSTSNDAGNEIVTESNRGFYSGSWQLVEVDKQRVIAGFQSSKLLKIECEGIVNDSVFPKFLIVTDAKEYRWPISESGAAYVDAKELAIREAAAGSVVYCNWTAVTNATSNSDTVKMDALPGENILLGGFEKPREFSIQIVGDPKCQNLAAQLYIDGNQLETVDGVAQKLTPSASFFGIAKTIEAKISGTCSANSIPQIKLSVSTE